MVALGPAIAFDPPRQCIAVFGDFRVPAAMRVVYLVCLNKLPLLRERFGVAVRLAAELPVHEKKRVHAFRLHPPDLFAVKDVAENAPSIVKAAVYIVPSEVKSVVYNAPGQRPGPGIFGLTQCGGGFDKQKRRFDIMPIGIVIGKRPPVRREV